MDSMKMIWSTDYKTNCSEHAAVRHMLRHKQMSLMFQMSALTKRAENGHWLQWWHASHNYCHPIGYFRLVALHNISCRRHVTGDSRVKRDDVKTGNDPVKASDLSATLRVTPLSLTSHLNYLYCGSLPNSWALRAFSRYYLLVFSCFFNFFI